MARRAANVVKAGRQGSGGSDGAARSATGGVTEPQPNAPSLRNLARAHAAAAVEALAAVMRDSSATPAARVSAAGALLAWGYGKAVPGETEEERRPAEQIVRLVWGGGDD